MVETLHPREPKKVKNRAWGKESTKTPKVKEKVKGKIEEPTEEYFFVGGETGGNGP